MKEWVKRGETGALAYEAAGLRWLAVEGGPRVPSVIVLDGERLVTERIDVGPWSTAADEDLGRRLATVHRAGAPAFGWDEQPRGFIGPLPQSNEPMASWPAFYVERRVLPFVRAAVDGGGLSARGAADVEHACSRIIELAGPPEPPARIHGDLWRGNVLADERGQTWIIDPAAHGGHRETDLAMLRLFGGFGERCFAAYDEAHPLAEGWQERVELHQLHPLLVHAILFGSSYGAHAAEVARRYA